MNIGILTFHWATNYGAILQCYALQNYLTLIGHNVKIINYKPKQFDESFLNFVRYCKFLHLKDYINVRRKEYALQSFRNNHLNLTKRLYTCLSISEVAAQFDLIISGSDQVANPSFLMLGEGNNIITPTYFLGFPFEGKRVGYALSFGCINYPENAQRIASKYIIAFDNISVREVTGINIVKALGRNDVALVPDPTLLMESDFYHSLADKVSLYLENKYVYCFFIRHIQDRKIVINEVLRKYKLLWNNDDGDYSIEGWLCKIKHSKFVVTDSFHCVVMCLKLHIPFVAITEQEGNVGMNDRLYTLLEKLHLCEQICFKDNIPRYRFQWTYDWNEIDLALEHFGKIGKTFLNKIFYENIMVQ